MRGLGNVNNTRTRGGICGLFIDIKFVLILIKVLLFRRDVFIFIRVYCCLKQIYFSTFLLLLGGCYGLCRRALFSL